MLALRGHRLRLHVLDRRSCGAVGLLADEDRVHRRRRLEPRGGVDHVAGDHSFAVPGLGPQRDDRLAGVDRDPDLEVEPFHGVQVADPVPDPEGRPHRPLGVVAVGDRGAEDAHDGVADELLHRAPERLDLVAKACVVRRQDRADVLGVELLGPRREADEVGEKDGDDAPLLARALWRRRRAQLSAAVAAEAEVERARRSADAARERKGAAAVAAEALAALVLVPAVRAAVPLRHARLLRP